METYRQQHPIRQRDFSFAGQRIGPGPGLGPGPGPGPGPASGSEPARLQTHWQRSSSQHSHQSAVLEHDTGEPSSEELRRPPKKPRRRKNEERLRSTIACIPCRVSKLKCDGKRPSCTRCTKVDDVCKWPEVDGRSTRGKIPLPSNTRHRDPNDLDLLANAASRHGPNPGSFALPMTPSSQGSAFSITPSASSASKITTASSLIPLVSMDLPPADIQPEQQRMWWEQDPYSSSQIPFQMQQQQQHIPPNQNLYPSTATHVNPASFDWSSLGLGPQDLTQEVLDTLSGQIAWIDQPNEANSKDDNIGHATDSTQDNSQAANGGGGGGGREEEGQVVRMQYFRLLGPTGISPGIKKVSVEFRLTPSMRKALFDSDSNVALQGKQRLDWNKLLSMGQEQTSTNTGDHTQLHSQGGVRDPSILFDGDLPAQWVLDELIPIFFERLGDHYLCLNRKGLEKRLADERHRVPPMLINVICALAARYSNDSRIVAGRSSQRSHTFGMEFADKAKAFLAPSLTVPSRTTTVAFLMMAWHEFACNLDSAFWMYAGMALRMAIDLGIHRDSASSSPRDLNDVDFIDDALLFWAVYQMDRCLAMGTGRPTSIKDREITCRMPDHLDSTSQVNIIFAHHIRNTRVAGEVAEALNAVLSPDEAAREGIRLELDRLEDKLLESYESIPPFLRLTPQNFQESTCKHLFLEFHLRFHCLLLVLNRAPVVQRRTAADPSDALRIVRKSVQRCADIVALDEAHGGQYLVCIPMGNQTFFLAGCAELDECSQRPSPHPSSSTKSGVTSRSSRLLMLDAMESHRHFARVLERMSVYWDGIRWIYGVLMQRKIGLSDNDLVELDVGTDSLVSQREMRMLQILHAKSTESTGPNSPWPPPLQVSEVVSLEELTSVLPQLQNAVA